MRLFRIIVTVLAVVTAIGFAPSPSVWAETGEGKTVRTLTLDSTDTYVGFEVKYLLLLTIKGQFEDFAGEVLIDPAQPQNSRADIIIKTASVNTGSPKRDEDIRGPQLFHAARYPEMIYHSKSVRLARDDNKVAHILGDLTLRGVTRPVEFMMVSKRPLQLPGGVAVYNVKDILSDGFILTGKIKRSDFGMNEFVRPIGDTVSLFVCYKMERCGSDALKASTPAPTYNE